MPSLRRSVLRLASFNIRAAAFNNGEKILVVVTENGTPGQQRNFRIASQFDNGLAQPIAGRFAIQAYPFIQQAAARFAAFIRDDHPGTAACRRPRRHQAGRAGTRNQHIAMNIAMGVLIGIGQFRRNPQPGRPANETLIPVPQHPGPHERLVVKARAEQPVAEIRHRHGIETQARPAPHGGRGQAFVQFQLRRPNIRRRSYPLADLDYRVGLFRAAADDAPRTVVLKAPTDHAHAIGK